MDHKHLPSKPPPNAGLPDEFQAPRYEAIYQRQHPSRPSCQCVTIGNEAAQPGTHATLKCAFEHTTAGRPMIEFVCPDLVECEIYGRLNACREKAIRSNRSDKIRQILVDALRATLAALPATAPKVHPILGSTIHATSKRSLTPLSGREKSRAEAGRDGSRVRVSEPRRPAYRIPPAYAGDTRLRR
jgi:hypothetical protein